MSGLFNNLYAATKFLVTLPCTQVTCERCFSKLKKFKDCSRTSLSQDLLSSLLLIFVEPDLANEINIENVIDTFALSSNELKRLLL